MRRIWLLLLLLTLGGCVGLPAGVTPVADFKADRYLGQWYEIARLDHRFERGLSHVTAEYGLRDDGGLTVLNRGYRADEKQWKQAQGKAYFVQGSEKGFLKVSFFGPFYGSYVVFELDQQDYRWSMISGPDKSYLWLLARSPTLDNATRDRLVARAAALGFDTDKLIFVDHTPLP